uniref:Uncharacterized protein n=1 Tax=Spongospora subterranea TaxID=70186 RepID=A0A0H5QHE7_9EUKA|eukprot:CRZ01393.1 hypothetical protein [Spongospora subterranea]
MCFLGRLERESRVSFDQDYFRSLIETQQLDQLLIADQYFSCIVSMNCRPSLVLAYQIRVHIYLLHLQSGAISVAKKFLKNVVVNTIKFHDVLFSTNSVDAIDSLTSCTPKDAAKLIPFHFDMLKELCRRTMSALIEPSDEEFGQRNAIRS